MAKLLTPKMGVQFLLGFLIGKIFGAVVSTVPLIELFLGDSPLWDLLVEEFISQLLSFNGYHYALAIIGGLILAIWSSSDIFE